MTKPRTSPRGKRDQGPRKRRQVLLVVSAVVVAVFVVVILVVLSGENEPELEPLALEGDVQIPSGVTADGDVFLGMPDAPVTVIEYSDYFCGHCRDFAAENAPKLEDEFIATGKVRWVIPYYALGKDARLSVVEATACAADQGRFFEYRRLLFANQRQLGQTPIDQWRSLLIDYAQQVGLEVGTFEQCWDQGVHQAEILASIDKAWQQGMTSTPRFLINGQLIVGNQPYQVFQQAIQEALATSQ